MKTYLLTLAAVVCLCRGGFAAEAKRPNILFIVVDDLRDVVGCYGYKAVKTPNIDRLAERGVRFDRAYVQYPVCNPSRTSFLTGLRPDATQIYDNATPMRKKLPDVVTFPQLLKEHGWFTAAYGKIFHLGGRGAKERGTFVDREKSWNVAETFEPTATGREQYEGRNLTGGKLEWCRWASAKGTDDDQPDGQTAAAVIAELDRRKDEPWLIGAGFHRPHDPFISPKKYFDLYPLDSLVLYRDPADMSQTLPLALGGGGYGGPFSEFTDAERREFQRAYFAGVSFTDAQVGRLLDALDERKLWNDTIVIFISDHGYHLGERQWWSKNSLFERTCRVPFIVAAPDAKPGVARGLVELVDLYPTIADYCGLTPPDGLAGTSFRPLLVDPTKAGKPAAVTIVKRGEHRGDTVRTDRWRYTQWSDGTQELYDQNADPDDIHNLADDSQYAGVVAEHRALLKP